MESKFDKVLGMLRSTDEELIRLGIIALLNEFTEDECRNLIPWNALKRAGEKYPFTLIPFMRDELFFKGNICLVIYNVDGRSTLLCRTKSEGEMMLIYLNGNTTYYD